MRPSYDPSSNPFPDVLGEVASLLHAEPPPPTSDVLAALLAGLLPGVPDAVYASVTWRRTPVDVARTPGASADLAEQVDQLQYATGEGPCLDACLGEVVTARGMELANRWPAFGPQVLRKSPVRAVLSHPLPGLEGRASVNFYAERPVSFDDSGAVTAAARAAGSCSIALAALSARQHVRNLEQALATSRQISAAIGIVMAQNRCTYDEAFARLRAVSQRSHRKVQQLAEDVVFTGAVPDVPA